jgi:hypothetical protein
MSGEELDWRDEVHPFQAEERGQRAVAVDAIPRWYQRKIRCQRGLIAVTGGEVAVAVIVQESKSAH